MADKSKSGGDKKVDSGRAARFTETGEGVRVIRPGKGEIDRRSIPPRRNEKD